MEGKLRKTKETLATVLVSSERRDSLIDLTTSTGEMERPLDAALKKNAIGESATARKRSAYGEIWLLDHVRGFLIDVACYLVRFLRKDGTFLILLFSLFSFS
jgi:hypothetical protein